MGDSSESGKSEQEEQEKQPVTRRRVKANLIEATPPSGAIGHWILASPLIVFLGWLWVDLFIFFSPIPWYWLDVIAAVAAFLYLAILPLGYVAHFLITSLPRLFQHSGWDVEPIEPVRREEMYMVRYDYQDRMRAKLTWHRAWVRAAQGWVYLEIVVIFLTALLIIPVFFSVTDFGFGQF